MRLGFYSAQAVESVHSNFEVKWMNYKVLESNSESDSELLNAVG